MIKYIRLALQFDSEEIEGLYWDSIYRKNVIWVRNSAFIGLLINISFLYLDLVLVNENIITVYYIRFILSVSIIAFIVFTFSEKFLKYYHKAIFILALITGFSILALISVIDQVSASLYYAGILFVVLYATIFQLKFEYYLTTFIILLVSYEIVAIFINEIPNEILISNNYFLVFGMSIGVLSNYFLEKFSRENFYQKMKIEEAVEEAVEANQAKSEFLANMSHEFRTPLNSVIGFSQIMMKLHKSGRTDSFEKYLAQIKSGGENLLEIVNQILDFSKLEHHKSQLNISTVPLMELINEVYNQHFPMAHIKGIEYRLELTSELPHKITTDETKLKQALSNVISNAIKFTNTGSVVFDVKYQNNMYHFIVKDEGIGIAEENLDKVFSAFEQEDSSSSRQFGGTGLGLTISKNNIELMGGEIHVESVQGKGSIFEVKIPCQTA